MIIDTSEQLSTFITKYRISDAILIPIFSDINKHPRLNTVALIFVYLIDTQEKYVLINNHIDRIHDEVNLEEILNTSSKKKYLFNKKRLLHKFELNNSIDLDLLLYFKYSESNQIKDTETFAHQFFITRYYDKLKDINKIIPILKHVEHCEIMLEHALKILRECETYQFDNSFQYYNELVLHTLLDIEKNGLYVDEEKFINYFDKKSKNLLSIDRRVFSEYNMFTTTGRPSNRFGGINFSALNKDDTSRSCFTSRFDNGYLIEFDYDAYHLRLLAQLVGYKFPENISVHEYLAKHFFNKEIITQEDYSKSKEISFRQLYGGVQKEYENIHFFQNVSEYAKSIWTRVNSEGYIATPIFGRKLYLENFDDMNAPKLLNYLIQTVETEVNIIMFEQLNKFLEQYNTRVILYTYDSILIDYDCRDGKEILKEIKNIIEQNKKFPVKIKIGKNNV